MGAQEHEEEDSRREQKGQNPARQFHLCPLECEDTRIDSHDEVASRGRGRTCVAGDTARTRNIGV